MNSVTGARTCNTLKGALRRMRRAVRSLITPQGSDTHSISFMFECEEAAALREGGFYFDCAREESIMQSVVLVYDVACTPSIAR